MCLQLPGFHADLKRNVFEGYTHLETQCFLFLISSALFTRTYCSTVIKKLMQGPCTILTFHQGWDVFFFFFFFAQRELVCYLLRVLRFILVSGCFFENPLPSLNSFCCFKDQRKRKGLWFTRRRCCVRRQWGIQSGDSLTFFCQTAHWWFSISGLVMKQMLSSFQCT